MPNPELLSQNIKEVVIVIGSLAIIGLAAHAYYKQLDEGYEIIDTEEISPTIVQVLYCAATDENVWKYIHLRETTESEAEAIRMLPSFNPVQLKTAYLLGRMRSEKRWNNKGK